jgi:isoquinoline 1-oxidoreductase beta subunit
MPIGRGCGSRARRPMPSAITNFAFGMQGTGGSSAMANSWMQLRDAGAKARAMLLAAARDWHVPVAELTVDKGVVYHAASKRQATFGSLVPAATLPVPEQVTLKDPKTSS